MESGGTSQGQVLFFGLRCMADYGLELDGNDMASRTRRRARSATRRTRLVITYSPAASSAMRSGSVHSGYLGLSGWRQLRTRHWPTSGYIHVRKYLAITAGGSTPSSSWWKERNRRTFQAESLSPPALLRVIVDEANAWMAVGLKAMSVFMAHGS